MNLTIAFLTNRVEPQIRWFFDSLHRELDSDYSETKIVVVDFHADDPGRRDAFSKLTHWPITHVTPKPTVWQGKHRLTKIDYFAAANARNTAICLAPDGWIAFVDDLSVLMPGWLGGVRRGMAGNYGVLGSYKKVKDLVVDNGEVKSFTPNPSGVDSRWSLGSDTAAVHMNAADLYGCSFALPIEWLLNVNGFDENCDSLGSEDSILGARLQNMKYPFKYDLRMLTYESEEGHAGTVFKRFDKGVSPNDKSHAILAQARGSTWAPNYFGEGGIRALRQRILAGEPFPVSQVPQHDWYDSQPLSEL